jgi:hypothetical protein
MSSNTSKVVLRLRNGQVIKGRLARFTPEAGLVGVSVPPVAEVQLVALESLKAVFYVKDYAGNPAYNTKRGIFTPDAAGHRIRVRFHDGEELWGTAENLPMSGPGYFLRGGDPDDNNDRVYVVRSSAATIEILG